MKIAVLSVGVINIPTGKTQYDWDIYSNSGLHAYLTNGGYLLLGRKDCLSINDTYDLIGNDSNRRLSKVGRIIDMKSCEDRNDFIQWLKSHNYDYTPIRAFKKRPASNKRLITSYSIKGILG